MRKICSNCRILIKENKRLRARVEALEEEIALLRQDFANYIARTEKIMLLAEKKINELKEENKQLKQKIAELEDKNERLRKRRFKFNIRKDEKKGKKPGAPTGHIGVSRRKPATVHEYVDIYPKVCKYCGNEDIKVYNSYQQRTVEDIDIRVRRICFRNHYGYCPRCKRSLYPSEGKVLPKILVGQNVRAIAVALRYNGLSFGKVQKIFEDVLGMKLSRTTLLEFETKMAEKGQEIYQQLKRSLCKSSLLHIDETGWRVNGINHWLWCFTNNDVVLYHIDRQRSGDVARKLLGEKYNGVVISDFYSAYNKLFAKTKQKCIVHLLRDIREIEENKNLGNVDKLFCKELKCSFKAAIDLWKGFKHAEIGMEELKKGRDLIAEKLTKIMLYEIENEQLQTIRKRILKHNSELLTFLDMPEVEPTNNKAERALRPAVIFRKIGFGNRSQQGVKNHQTLMSIINTAKLYGKKPLDMLHALVSPAPQPISILPLPLPP